LGLRATFINSSLTYGEQQDRMSQMAAGEYDLVYVAPERLRNARFLEAVRAINLQLLAVDEAHCISEWGHDFRPDYARLGRFRERLGFPQTIALTATATPTVRTDIIDLLQLKEPRTFITGFARPNLRFEVAQASGEFEKDATLLEFLKENPGAGIVYAATRRRCEEVVELLANRTRRTYRRRTADACRKNSWRARRRSSSPPMPLAWASTRPRCGSWSTTTCPARSKLITRRRAAPAATASPRAAS
jgi:ATP-dependent DNA helicase RecQ